MSGSSLASVLRRRLLATSAALLTVVVGPPAMASPGTTTGPAVTREGNNVWYLRDTQSTGVATTTFRYGRSGDVSVFGDWDGDGLATPGVVRGTKWFLRNSNTSGVADVTFEFESLGGRGGIPVIGDWDGDGVDTPGYVQNLRICNSETGSCRPGGSRWYLRNSNSDGGEDEEVGFQPSGAPVVGDWDGDGDDNIGIVTDAEWNLDTVGGGTAEHRFLYGRAADVPVVGDWDGDGSDDPGVFRSGRWFVRYQPSSGPADHAFSYGSASDSPHTWATDHHR